MKECKCKITEKFLDVEAQNKLMQFFMRLNDSYKLVHSQILSMDPLPTVNKVYYIVQQVKVQKKVTSHVPEAVAFMANDIGKKNQGGFKSYGRN